MSPSARVPNASELGRVTIANAVPRQPPSQPTGSPRGAALRLLGRREYTRTELRTRLLEKGYDQRLVDEALDQLAADKWLDDRRVAAAHVRTSSRLKGRGRRRIQRELEHR